MLDLKFVCDHLEDVTKNLNRRGDYSKLLTSLSNFQQQRKKTLLENEKLKQLQNTVTEEISKMKMAKQDASQKISEMKKVSDTIKTLDKDLKDIEDKIKDILLNVPNLLHSSVPDGKDSQDNQEIRKWGNIPKFDFPIKDHLTLGEKLGIIDTERASKFPS